MTDTHSKWQPIETAPTDGTFVDIWIEKGDGTGERIPRMYYSVGDTTEANDWKDEHGFWSVVGDGSYSISQVTHWRSEPPSPREEQSQ